jgi:transposase, IS30 family
VAFEAKDVAGFKARFLEVLDRVGKISVAAGELGIGHALGRSWAREAGFEAVRGRRRHPRRGEYEQLRAGGVPQGRAAEQAGVNLRTARDWDRGVKKGKSARTYPGGLRVDYAAGTATMGGVTSPAPGLAALEKQLHPRFLTLASASRSATCMPRASRCGRSEGRWGGRPARFCGRSGLTRAGTATSRTLRTGRQRHGGPGRRNTRSWPAARCGSSSRTGCGGGGHQSRYATLYARSIPATRACG